MEGRHLTIAFNNYQQSSLEEEIKTAEEEDTEL